MQQLLIDIKTRLGLQGVERYVIKSNELSSMIDVMKKKCSFGNKRYIVSIAKDDDIKLQIIHPRVLKDSSLVNFKNDELNYVKKFNFGLLIPTFHWDQKTKATLQNYFDENLITSEILIKETKDEKAFLVLNIPDDRKLVSLIDSYISYLHNHKESQYLQIEFVFWSYKRVITLE
jgi:hypothetical protein